MRYKKSYPRIEGDQFIPTTFSKEEVAQCLARRESKRRNRQFYAATARLRRALAGLAPWNVTPSGRDPEEWAREVGWAEAVQSDPACSPMRVLCRRVFDPSRGAASPYHLASVGELFRRWVRPASASRVEVAGALWLLRNTGRPLASVDRGTLRALGRLSWLLRFAALHEVRMGTPSQPVRLRELNWLAVRHAQSSKRAAAQICPSCGGDISERVDDVEEAA
jgi:hypothetical protein